MSWSTVASAPARNGGTATAGSTAVTLGAAVAVNDVIYVHSSRGTTATDDSASDTCADSLGNTYTMLGHGWDSSDHQDCVVWTSVVTHAGTPTITVTYPTTYGFREVEATAHRCSVSGTPTLDVGTVIATEQPETAGAIQSGSVTPAQDNELLIGSFVDTSAGGTTITAGTGMTLDINGSGTSSGNATVSKDLGAGSGGTGIRATATDSGGGSAFFLGAVVLFKQPAAASAVKRLLTLMGMGS